MTDIERIEEIKESLTFNLFVGTEDGRVAWTVNPVSLDELLTDRLSGCPPLILIKSQGQFVHLFYNHCHLMKLSK